MTSEEKSKEILRQFNFAGLHNGRKVYGFALDRMKQIARWERDQMIKKACDWLKDMACIYAYWEYNGDTYEKEVVYDTEQFIKDFIKAMEGGEE